jgi:hypothetical protein
MAVSVAIDPSTSRGTNGTNTNVQRKRAIDILDPDTGDEILESKKPRIEPDIPKKLAAFKFLMHSSVNIISRFGSPINSVSAVRNINLNAQISNIFFTCHNILRQRASRYMGNMEKKSQDKDFIVTYFGKSYNVQGEESINLVKKTATFHGLEYKNYKPDDKENWLRIAGPYLCFFVGFGLRIAELHIGHSNIPIKKDGDKTTGIPVQSMVYMVSIVYC